MSRLFALCIAICLLATAFPALAQEPAATSAVTSTQSLTGTAGITATVPLSGAAAAMTATETVTATAPVTATETMSVTPGSPVTTTLAVDWQALFHDAISSSVDNVGGVKTWVAKYGIDSSPWLDLLVQLPDGEWYGPERNPDWIFPNPLPAGVQWMCTGGFTCLPNGEAWWTGPAPEGQAILTGLGEWVVLPLRVDLQVPSGAGEPKGAPVPPPPPQQGT